MKLLIANFLHSILELLGDENPKEVTKSLATIRDNHLAHLQGSVDDLHLRVGSLEGKMALLLTLALVILGSVIAPLLVAFIKS